MLGSFMHRLGVCSWSLRPQGPQDLVEKVRATGLSACQLALDPIRTRRWGEAELREALVASGIAVLSGMIEMQGEDYSTLESIRTTGGVRPDRTWNANLAAAREDAALAERLGISLVTFHAGFLPHEPAALERAAMLARVRDVARVFAGRGIRVALETGQESAPTLLPVLEELADAGVGVNFDPANMILYGMGDPVAALRELGAYVRQVHVKDARPAAQPGTWGTEVPVGSGAVDWQQFFATLARVQPGVALLIEREAGDRRVEDVRTAKALVESLLR